MSASTSEWEQRLDRLERRERRRGRATIIGALGLIVGIAVGAGGTQEITTQDERVVPMLDTLQARRIDIIDAEGRVTCTLTTEQEGPGAGSGLVVLRNADGRSVCRVGSRGGHGALSLHSADGSTACSAGALGNGGWLEVYGPDGEQVGRLRSQGGAGSLSLSHSPDVAVVLSSDETGALASN